MRDRHGAVFWDMLMLQILAFHFTDTSGSPAYAGLALDSGHMQMRTIFKVNKLSVYFSEITSTKIIMLTLKNNTVK